MTRSQPRSHMPCRPPRVTARFAHQARTVNDHLGDGVSVRRWSSAALLGLGLVILTPATASAEPPNTPGQAGEQGCRTNGQVIACVASGPGNFGEVVRQNAPIADNNAEFFDDLCG